VLALDKTGRETPLSGPDIAIIVNVSTKWVSTLALLSALRFLDMPVTMIDCDSNDGSFEHFVRLQRDHQFSLMRLPLQLHGITLDSIFSSVDADRIWLLDSDAEILDSGYVRIMKTGMQQPGTFGAGFVHGPAWLTATQTGLRQKRVGLYEERMWVPFTCLDRQAVARALSAGYSFRDGTITNELPQVPALSRLLYRRFQRQKFDSVRLDFLAQFRRSYSGHRPHYVYSDTGAAIFRHLKNEVGMSFCGIGAQFAGPYVAHYHGVTRALLNENDHNSTHISGIIESVYSRLASEYGISTS
jgi:hypothetical protein